MLHASLLGETIGKNVQVYVDDIVIKTRVEDTLLADIREMFDSLMHVKCIDEFCIFSHGFLLHIAS